MKRGNIMKLKGTVLGIAAAIGVFTIFGGAEAARLDAYRTMLETKRFTLKYEVESANQTFGETATYEKDGVSYPLASSIADATMFMMNRVPSGGVVVVKGADKYFEAYSNGQEKIAFRQSSGVHSFTHVTDLPALTKYFLEKNGEKFYFDKRTSSSGKITYLGGVFDRLGINRVEAGQYIHGPKEAMEREMNYGHPVIGWILSSILPDKNLPASTAPPSYAPAGEGRSDGFYYEDYSAEKDNTFYAMRYYFDGDRLVKVSSVSYTKDADGNIDESGYERRTVKIVEFSPKPDESYLSLPEGLKDVTKRKKKTKAVDDE